MKLARLFLLLLPVLFFAEKASAQSCPTVIFWAEPVDSVNCNSTGDFHMSLAVCPASVTVPYELDSVVWNMGNGVSVMTNTLEIDYTYAVSNTYSVSAMAYFTVNGVSCSTQVLNAAVAGTVNLNTLCGSSLTYTTYSVNIHLLNVELYTTPTTPPPTTATGVSIMMDYQGVGVSSGILTYQLLVDGLSVVPAGTAVPSNLTLYGPGTFSEGQHTAEVIVMNKAFRNCPVIAVTQFEILPVPEDPASCLDCFTFRPDQNKRYWISAWVKEDQVQVQTYTNASIKLNFVGSGQAVLTLLPTGEIIDGWQRIAADFTVPANTTSIDIKLNNASSSVAVYFDDIRVHPFNASMKSYAYDPETFWLTAELDDNNYATFYEYDKEGQLIRIKQETEKGIVTIKETRTSNPVKQ